MDKVAILIPARYKSKRYPGKPLCLLDGIPMIKRVVDKCKKSNYPVFVLTDDSKIANCINKNTTVLIEDEDYANGTERCAGQITKDLFTKYDYFINVQGDMPDITPTIIERCVSLLQQFHVTTVYTDISEENRKNLNSVKLIRNGSTVLWFGRGFTDYGDHHLGIYGYSRHALGTYKNLKIPEEEKIEGLEQLRWLKNDFEIGCSHVEFNGVEINTPNDVEEWLNGRI